MDMDKNQIKHNGSMAQSLNGYRADGTMCDVTIIVGDEEFQAHRLVLSAASNYYETMFNVEMKENMTGRVEMQDISVATFRSCIEYIYTGLVNIHADNVHDLLQASALQQILDLKNLCLGFMQKNLTLRTCIESFNMSKLYESHELRESVETFMIENFEPVAKLPDFNKFMDEISLEKIMASDKLKISNEKVLCEILIAWTKFDEENRGGSLAALIQHLRLRLLPVEYLHSFMSEDVVKTNKQCVRLLQEAIADIYMRKGTGVKRCEDELNGRRLLLIKKGVQLNDNPVLSFSPDHHSWSSFSKGTEYSAVACAVMDNKLYAVGSKLQMSILDLKRNTWSAVARNAAEKNNFALAVHQESLYLVGGTKTSNLSFTSEVISYSPVNQQWTDRPRMQQARSSITVNSVGGSLYVFGYYTPEKFFNNKWSFIQTCENANAIKYSAVKDGLIYVIAENAAGIFLNVYHPIQNYWMHLKGFSLPPKISGIGGVDDDLYIVGSDGNGKSSIKQIDFSNQGHVFTSQKYEDWENVCFIAY